MRWTDRQTCPAWTNAPRAACFAAAAISTSSSMISPPLPPSSSVTRLRTALAFNAHPTLVLPVKNSALTRSSVTRRSATGGRSGGGRDFGQQQRRSRTLRRRLDDHCVAGGQRRRDLVAHQVERKIERRDRGDRTDRKTLHHPDCAGTGGIEIERLVMPAEALGLLRGQRENSNRARDLGAGIADRLAGAVENRVLEITPAFGDSLRDRGQNFRALGARKPPRFGKGARGSIDRRIRLSGARPRNPRDDFAGVGIFPLVTVLAAAVVAVNEKAVFADRCHIPMMPRARLTGSPRLQGEARAN